MEIENAKDAKLKCNFLFSTKVNKIEVKLLMISRGILENVTNSSRLSPIP